MKTTIRRARPTEPLPWDLLLSADGPRPEIEKYLARGELWLAECGGDIVGEMVLMETRVDVWEIMNLAVSQSVQRQGIGTRLLKRAKTMAKQRRAHRLEVGTGNGGVGQLAFYQRFGFRIVGIDANFFVRRWHKVWTQNGIPLRDMVRMEIALDV
jgi:ribosomal protein S18 acetylase RimI-like enzyme